MEIIQFYALQIIVFFIHLYNATPIPSQDQDQDEWLECIKRVPLKFCAFSLEPGHFPRVPLKNWHLCPFINVGYFFVDEQIL